MCPEREFDHSNLGACFARERRWLPARAIDGFRRGTRVTGAALRVRAESCCRSTEGATLRREKLLHAEPSRVDSDARGHLFTLDATNSLRAHGENLGRCSSTKLRRHS